MTVLVSVFDQISLSPTYVEWLQPSVPDCGFLFLPVQKQRDDTSVPNRAKRRHARPQILDSEDDDDEDERNEEPTKKETPAQQHPVVTADDPQKLVKTKFYRNRAVAE